MSNYADNILDKDGNPIYLEDKHLNDQTSQTAIATTDAVMLKDTNGEYHSIEKASFNEAVRAAMGSILTNFDKGSSVTRIPGIDSNNDLGSVTAANLASVLGVPVFGKMVETNAIDGLLPTSLCGHIAYGSHGAGAVLTCGYGSTGSERYVQVDFTAEGIFHRYRYNSTTWSSWKQVSLT